MTDNTDSWLPYAGVGGAVVCCLGLEFLGGVAVVSGLAATLGLSAGLTYAAVVVLGGALMALLAVGYRNLGGVQHG